MSHSRGQGLVSDGKKQICCSELFSQNCEPCFFGRESAKHRCERLNEGPPHSRGQGVVSLMVRNQPFSQFGQHQATNNAAQISFVMRTNFSWQPVLGGGLNHPKMTKYFES